MSDRLSTSLNITAARFRADADAEASAGNPEAADALTKLAVSMERIATNHRASAILADNPARDPTQIDPETEPDDTPRRFRETRQSRGMSQAAVARAMGVDVMTVSRWERGNRIPGYALLALDAIVARHTEGAGE